MKRVLASLLILLWPLAFTPKAFATRGGSPDSRLKPLTLKGAGLGLGYRVSPQSEL